MKPISQSSIHFEHILRFMGTLVLIGILIFYVQYQARNLINGPSIQLTVAPNPTPTERTVHIEGITKNIITLSLNGKPLPTDEHGVFKDVLVLENGYTIMTLRAEDRYGRKTSLSRTFVYVPTS